MKKKITIELDIDTEAEGYSRSEMRGNLCRIIVQKDRDGFHPLSVVCHEFGHILGHIFSLPKHVSDPRVNFLLSNNKETFDYHQRILDNEEQAWDLAEILFMLRNDREKALATYRKYV